MKKLLLTFLLVPCLCACQTSPLTIAPHGVVSREASFDGNQQNSGIVWADENGFYVTSHFLARHGIPASAAVPAGVNYRITAEQMDKAITADQRRKNEQK